MGGASVYTKHKSIWWRTARIYKNGLVMLDIYGVDHEETWHLVNEIQANTGDIIKIEVYYMVKAYVIIDDHVVIDASSYGGEYEFTFTGKEKGIWIDHVSSKTSA